jgi:ADP-heptose:LPS heptosyltransferase
MKSLVVGPFFGELGFEVGYWLPFVRERVRRGRFEQVAVLCQQGHECLYSFLRNPEFYPCVFSGKMDHAEGTGFRHATNKYYEEQLSAAKALATTLQKERSAFQLMPDEWEDAVFIPRDPLPLRLYPEKRLLKEWAKALPERFVALSCRLYDRGVSKNSSLELLDELACGLRDRGYETVIVGVTAQEVPRFAEGLNLMNKTSLSALVAILSMADVVIGSSSGTLHLASACGTPHITWGGVNWGELTRKRYLETWNPNGTWCRFLETPGYSWKVEGSRVLEAFEEATMIVR